MLSDLDSIKLSKDDYLFWSNSNTRAVEYYNEYLSKLDTFNNHTEESISELEDIFSSMIDSKESTKH
jgi:hypothetical protein